MQRGWLTRTFKGDKAIWGIITLFMVYSLLAVYSSSVGVAFMKHGGNTTYFLISQLLMLAFSLAIIVFAHHLSYKIYFSVAGIVLLISIGLLILTLFVGARVNEATRALVIPIIGVRIQTSDIAKVALVLYLARTLAKYQGKLDDYSLVFKYIYVPVSVVCALILPENLSTALMIFGISLIIMFIGGVPKMFIFSHVVITIVAVIIFAFILLKFTDDNRVKVWIARIEHFFSRTEDPDGDYQSNQAKIAISTGGMFGKTPGGSVQRNMLPQANSDFIFAIIIEEYGLVFGAIPLILAYIILLFRGIKIARKCETAFPAYVVLGLIVMIVVQAMFNMMVSVGLFPVTGQTLPMVSWGRTSAMVMSFSIGAVLGVSRVINARIKKKEELPKEELIDEGEKIYEPA